MSKSGAFVLAMAMITSTFVICVGLLLLNKISEGTLPVTAILTAYVTLTGSFIGLQVANNGVKGKFFNEGLVEKEEE